MPQSSTFSLFMKTIRAGCSGFLQSHARTRRDVFRVGSLAGPGLTLGISTVLRRRKSGSIPRKECAT